MIRAKQIYFDNELGTLLVVRFTRVSSSGVKWVDYEMDDGLHMAILYHYMESLIEQGSLELTGDL